MREIMLRITGTQFIGTAEEDRMEFVTDGRLYEKNGATYLVYDESELSGMPGCMTTLRLRGNTVRMKRIGEQALGAEEMEFEPGKRMTTKYETPYGMIDMELLTNSVENRVGEDGTALIDYHISLDGLAEGRNTLKIEVDPELQEEIAMQDRR